MRRRSLFSPLASFFSPVNHSTNYEEAGGIESFSRYLRSQYDPASACHCPFKIGHNLSLFGTHPKSWRNATRMDRPFEYAFRPKIEKKKIHHIREIIRHSLQTSVEKPKIKIKKREKIKEVFLNLHAGGIGNKISGASRMCFFSLKDAQ